MHILVVEDEPNVAAFIVQGLREEGYVVDHAADGELGLAYAQSADYDLIVLDVLLPRLNGRDVARTLRSQRNAAPILMLTALDDVADRVAGLDSGADDYLVKPFAYQELLARVRARTRNGTRPGSAATVQLGDLTLNRLTRTAQRGGAEVELTSKEFALLEFLMLHPGQALSRTQIGEHVWGYDFFNESNIVDVYIGYLRRKIDDGHAPLIRTVRGVGYRMTAEG